MRTYVERKLANPDLFCSIIMDIFLKDVEDLSKNESVFCKVMQSAMGKIADTVAEELTPKIKEYVLAKIDIEKIVQDAARKHVEDLLFPSRKQ